VSKVFTCPRCGRVHTYEEYNQSRFCRSCGTFLRLQTEKLEKRKTEPEKIELKTNILRNVEKATLIGSTLYYQFKSKTGFFDGYEMPEYIPPSGLDRSSKEYALYLTYVIAIDFQTDAVKLWSRSRKLYEEEPHLFNPEVIVDFDKKELRRIVKSLGARYPNGGADGWIKISKLLLEKYDGDPRNITKEAVTLAELKRKLNEFPYLRGNKLSNFYIRAMGENGLFKISDFDNLSIAVDIQVARVTFYTGVLQIQGDYYGCIHHDPIRSLIEDVWSEAAKNIEIPSWYLDEPLWSIGSRLCSKRKCKKCPIIEYCNNNFNIRFKGSKIQIF